MSYKDTTINAHQSSRGGDRVQLWISLYDADKVTLKGRGKKYFLELNYISWGEDEFKASMWGLSVGIPIGGFLSSLRG